MAERDLDALCSLAGVLFPPVRTTQDDSEKVSAYKKLDGQQLRAALNTVRL